MDKITGGRGNDILTGDNGLVAAGAGDEDIFIFGNHSGKDVITDFHDGEDRIDLTGYSGLDSFADRKGHIKQIGEDLVVSLLNGDQLTLQDTQKADLDATDFEFTL